MGVRYLVLGSGMQGTASGYYFSQFGEAAKITMADLHPQVAQKAAQKINDLNKNKIAEALTLNVKDRSALREVLKNHDAVLSAIDYALNLEITQACIEAGVHMVDLGGNTDVVRKQHELNAQAKAKNISIVPDCGLAPGLGNSMGAYGIEHFDQCHEVQVRCGGLPQKPRPPLDYKLVFNIKGLTNEYFGKAWILREGQIKEIDTFSELESLEFKSPVGKCEAFVTTGGTSTCPWTFKDKVETYEYKTVRYPGHFEKFKVMMDLGLLDLEPVQVGDQKVSPRDLFHAVVPSHLDFPEDRDLIVIRATCTGTKESKKKQLKLEMILMHDEKTNFTAMEMGTGYPAALVLIHAAQGKAKAGVTALELALNNKDYMKDLQKNGLPIEITETELS
jgi:lysine 6-dehydrogenase